MEPKKTQPRELDEAAVDFDRRATGNDLREVNPDAVRIVAIGASAGGLEPLEMFFDSMPSDSGLAFVIIQHLSPDFKSLMNELLARHTTMPSCRVTDGMVVEPDKIFLIPPRMEMELENGRLRLKERASQEQLSLPIDIFFQSLAREAGERAIGIILSGTGSDGTRGIREIVKKGGLVLVQDPHTAKFDGMPRSVINAESSCAIASPSAMPDMVLAHLHGVDPNNTDESGADDMMSGVAMDPVHRILDLLRRRHGPDFGYYKASTVGRRIRRRAMLNHFNDLEAYAQCLQKDDKELNLLYGDLLIGVTAFFRDIEAFQSLEQRIVTEIAERMDEDYQVRIWVAACASGEEAYSIAMMFADYARHHNRVLNIKIFATDIHSHSLATASVGLYSADKLRGLSAERIKRYFEQIGDQYQVTPSLRRMIVFSQHNILKDPPFTRMDLVSCRNLLIYFGDLAQRKALALFHFALRKDGVLFLGTSETPNDLADEFKSIDSKWRIYKKRRDVRLAESTHLLPTIAPLPTEPTRKTTEIVKNSPPPRNLLPAFSRLIARFTPPGILLDQNGEIMHVFGDAHSYMSIGEGVFSPKLSEMVKPALKIPVSSAVDRVMRHGIKVVAKNIRLDDDTTSNISIVVEPLGEDISKPDYIHVRFEASDGVQPAPAVDETFNAQTIHDGTVLQARIGELEQDLRFTEESLQTTIEELETSNEELQATNEELMASNEELQSTNEELHSVNEELYTVSAEHQRKIEELTRLTDDMSNLLRSTDIGTVFVDVQLRIRKFTPAVARTFNLVGHDIGRSIEHVTYRFQDKDLHSTIRHVIETAKSVERQVEVEDGHTYLMRILPYRASETTVEGAVLTFIDVSDHLKALNDLRRSEERYRSIYNNSPAMMHSIDENGRIVRISDFWLKVMGYSRDEVIGRPAVDFLSPTSRKRALNEVAPGLLRIGSCDKRPFQMQKKNGDKVDVLISAIQSRDATGSEHSLAVLMDVTDRNRAIQDLERSRERLSLALKALHGGFFSVDCATGTFEASPELAELVGGDRDEALSFADWTARIHGDDKAKADLTGFLAGNVESDSTLLRIKDQERGWMWVDCQRRLVRDEVGKPERVIGMIVDVTDLKHAEDHALEQTHAVSLANEELERFAHIVAHDLRSPLRGVKNLCRFLKSDLKGKIDKATDDHLAMLDNQVEKMSHMLNDLLDYSLLQAEADKIEKIDVSKLIEEAAGLVLQKDGFKLKLEGKMPVLTTDPTPLSLVFRNLIDNAVKHHDQPTGTITVKASKKGDFARFAVIDDGPGIPEKFKNVIFEFFKSLDPQAGQRDGGQTGAGMGLTFVKKAVLKQGGAIDVGNNPEGRGACFTFTWPIEARAASREALKVSRKAERHEQSADR